MQTTHFAGAIAVLFATAAPSWAQVTADGAQGPTTVIDIAGHAVPVVKDGLYDRYRSNPPLDVIGKEHPELDLSWFRTLKREKVAVGFDTWSPNFYYKNASVTAVFTADLERLAALMPAKVREQVRPLQVWPGRGVVALTAYAYQYCDNDAYNEVSLSIVTNKPGTASLGPLTLLSQSRSKDFWGYVVKLPVNTELARVRGVVGYNLPKWLTAIRFQETASSVRFDVADVATGKSDLVLETAKLGELSAEARFSTTSFTNLDRDGQLIQGHAISRQLRHGASTRGDDVKLTLGEGDLSATLRSLKLGKLLRYEYVPQFQSALYTPVPLAAGAGK